MMAHPKRRTIRPTRKPAAKAKKAHGGARAKAASPRPTTKLDLIVAALGTSKGATLSDLMTLTGWQQHSIRGVIAGALKKRGLTIVSSKKGAERIYRIESGK